MYEARVPGTWGPLKPPGALGRLVHFPWSDT